MADTLTRQILFDGSRKAVVRTQLHSDGTGTVDGILVQKSELSGPPSKLVLEKVKFSVDGMQVVLEFDHTTDDHIASITGQYELDFTDNGRFQGYVDPGSAGGTGNIVGTTVGHTAGDKADMIFFLRKKY